MPFTPPIATKIGTAALPALEQNATKIAVHPDALASYRMHRAEQCDLAEINEFLLGDFLHNEPLNSAMELSREEGEGIFRELEDESCLTDGLSYVIRDPAADNRIIAVRLAYIMHRSDDDSHEATPPAAKPFKEEGANRKREEKLKQIFGIMHELDSNLWHLVPSGINFLASWGIISVDSQYKRRGLAGALLQHGHEELLEKGCQGIVALASAKNSQNLFKKLGYIRLSEIRHSDWKDPNTGEQVFHCKDGTDRVTLEFKPLFPMARK